MTSRREPRCRIRPWEGQETAAFLDPVYAFWSLTGCTSESDWFVLSVAPGGGAEVLVEPGFPEDVFQIAAWSPAGDPFYGPPGSHLLAVSNPTGVAADFTVEITLVEDGAAPDGPYNLYVFRY